MLNLILCVMSETKGRDQSPFVVVTKITVEEINREQMELLSIYDFTKAKAHVDLLIMVVPLSLKPGLSM